MGGRHAAGPRTDGRRRFALGRAGAAAAGPQPTRGAHRHGSRRGCVCRVRTCARRRPRVARPGRGAVAMNEDSTDVLRERLEAYEVMLAQLRRDDDAALRALAEDLERQAAATRAELDAAVADE